MIQCLGHVCVASYVMLCILKLPDYQFVVFPFHLDFIVDDLMRSGARCLFVCVWIRLMLRSLKCCMRKLFRLHYDKCLRIV